MTELDLSNPKPSREARQWAMFCHFAAFLGMWFPFGNLIGPLIIWQLKRESDPFIDEQGLSDHRGDCFGHLLRTDVCTDWLRLARPAVYRRRGAGGDCRGQSQ